MRYQDKTKSCFDDITPSHFVNDDPMPAIDIIKKPYTFVTVDFQSNNLFDSLIKQSRTSFWKHKHSNANPFNHTSSRSFRATDIPHRKNADEFIESKPITRTLPALSNRRELWRCLTSSWISFYPPPALLSPHIVPRNLTRHRLHFVAPFNI